MTKNLNKYSYILLVILVFTFISIGCQPSAEKPNQPNNNYGMDNNDLYNNNNQNGNNNGLNNNNNNINGNNNNLSSRAKKIADKIAAMSNVEDATVVISGNTALIGVDLTNDSTLRINDNMRKQIERTVKNADSSINKVSVTADPDIFDRIDEIGRNIRTGRPIKGFTDEIEDMIRRVTPNL
ncbi:YhcN/YlaJ family sporulation lipoprotein [Sporosalibacterium faouarense]|uniref:YhcN/YlaJ family sporulation lipoprotein n=1 Tax=Sporosalibacterium faouarense TaxID=516123 RepID=UPI00192C3953|nr:YhcN/YlaJ family sporulation lipoprotein [Sporosalibacterium faouarense]